jgi:hypothetical protein
MSPQLVQTWVRTRKDVCMRSPQPLQSCDVDAGLTAATRVPAHAALKVRMMRKWDHPASWLDVVTPALRLAPLCAEPPLLSGLGSGRRLRLAGCIASTESTS